MSAEEYLKEKFKDHPLTIKWLEQLPKIMESYAREYHAKEMERKLKKTPFRDFYTLAEWLHNNYEEISLNNGWKTQSDCQVPFDELPNENKETMLELTLRLLTHLKEQKQDKR